MNTRSTPRPGSDNAVRGEILKYYPEVAKSIGYLIRDNQHTQAVVELSELVDGIGPAPGTFAGADRAALNVLDRLHACLGEMTPAMIGLRAEICARVKFRAARYLSAEQIDALHL